MNVPNKAPNKTPKSFSKRWHIRHKYFKRTGLYSFVFKNLLKLIVILGALIGLILLMNQIFVSAGIDLNVTINKLIERVNTVVVLSVFFVSESILGWIPPDFFIVWAKTRPTEQPYINIAILGTISYMGGIVAYRLGELIRRLPRVNAYVERKYSGSFKLIRKWGGLVIVMAALFPLPYATTSTVAGIVKYPFRMFLLYGLTRYIRFFVYAATIFWGMGKL